MLKTGFNRENYTNLHFCLFLLHYHHLELLKTTCYNNKEENEWKINIYRVLQWTVLEEVCALVVLLGYNIIIISKLIFLICFNFAGMVSTLMHWMKMATVLLHLHFCFELRVAAQSCEHVCGIQQKNSETDNSLNSYFIFFWLTTSCVHVTNNCHFSETR